MNKWVSLVFAVLAAILTFTVATELRTYDTENVLFDKFIVSILWFGLCIDHLIGFLEKHKGTE